MHVIGGETFACEIAAETVDYRYREGGSGGRMQPIDLPAAIATRCLEVAAALDLPLAGIDLLRDADGEWWCFEVNPSPRNCFEEPTGLPMAAALARWLAGGMGPEATMGPWWMSSRTEPGSASAATPRPAGRRRAGGSAGSGWTVSDVEGYPNLLAADLPRELEALIPAAVLDELEQTDRWQVEASLVGPGRLRVERIAS